MGQVCQEEAGRGWEGRAEMPLYGCVATEVAYLHTLLPAVQSFPLLCSLSHPSLASQPK